MTITRTAILLCLFSVAALAAEPEQPEAESQAKPEPVEKQTVTEHFKPGSAAKNVEYTVTAGTMLMKDKEDKPRALMGFTAYVAKGQGSEQTTADIRL